MSEETGFQIGKRVFPFPERFRLGDPVLVEKLTGMTWMEFIERIGDPDEATDVGDPIMNLGMIGVSVWQQNPTWSRDRVMRFVQNISMDDLVVLAPEAEEETEEEEDDPFPLAQDNGQKDSDKSASPSRSVLELHPDRSSQKPPGLQASVTSSQA